MWTPLLATAKRRSPFSFAPAAGWKLRTAALALGTLGVLPAIGGVLPLMAPAASHLLSPQAVDLTVTGNQTASGPYNNILIQAGGILTLTGDITAVTLIIENGGKLVTDGFVASGGTFTLRAGGTLDVASTDGITKAGTPTAADGAIVFTRRNYSSDATYRFTALTPGSTGNGLPSTVRGIETGQAQVTLGIPSVSVRQMVHLGSGDLAVGGTTSAPGLRLLSNSTNTAMLVNSSLTSSGKVTGIAKVDRYISGSLYAGDTYRHLSSPVTTTTFADLYTGLGVAQFQPRVNPDYNDQGLRPTLTAANFPNVFFFDESVASGTGSFVEGYQSPGLISDPMIAATGYSLYTPAVTMNFVGPLQQGTGATRAVNVQVSGLGTPPGGTPPTFGGGWNLLGNPYPSPIDWDLVPTADLNAAGLAHAIYVQKSVDAGSAAYLPYTNGVGPVGTEILPMGQGFFVQKTSATGNTFTFKNVARVTSPTNPELNRATETRPLLELSLLQNGRAAKMADRTFVYFEQGATTGGNDDHYDAHKLPSGGAIPNLYTRAGNTLISINGQPALRRNVSIPLEAVVSVAGTYALNADRLINMPTGFQVYLIDALTGTTHNLSQNPVYSFQATAGNTTPRFTLQFRTTSPTGVSADQELTDQLSVFPNPVSNDLVHVNLGGLTTESNVALTLVNSIGQVVSRQQVTVANGAISTELDTRSLAKGLYTLRVGTNGGMTTRAIVVQ